MYCVLLDKSYEKYTHDDKAKLHTKFSAYTDQGLGSSGFCRAFCARRDRHHAGRVEDSREKASATEPNSMRGQSPNRKYRFPGMMVKTSIFDPERNYTSAFLRFGREILPARRASRKQRSSLSERFIHLSSHPSIHSGLRAGHCNSWETINTHYAPGP